MRRWYLVLAVLVTALALVAAGCGGDEEAAPPAPAPAEPAPAEPPRRGAGAGRATGRGAGTGRATGRASRRPPAPTSSARPTTPIPP